jgi:molybdopterin converting factor subunit 1
MRIKVLYFAAFREAAGRDEQTAELPARASVADLWRTLAAEVPLFTRFSAMPPAAVNREYVDGSTALQEGDEVAFLPPVAGG